VILRSFLIGFLNSTRAEATIKPAQNSSLTSPSLLASSTRAVSHVPQIGRVVDIAHAVNVSELDRKIDAKLHIQPF